MKTIVLIALVALFILSIVHFFTKKECGDSTCEIDTTAPANRAESIRRAKKNLCPKYNKNVDRDGNGRFIKKS